MKKTSRIEQRNYVYIVRCRDGSLYTGWTTDVARRLEEHNSGKGAKYTKSRRPVELVYVEETDLKEDALRREAAIKKLKREEKLKMIRSADQAAAADPEETAAAVPGQQGSGKQETES